MAVLLKRPYDDSIPNMARCKRSKPEEEYRTCSMEQVMEEQLFRRVWKRFLEQQSALQTTATQPFNIPPVYPLPLENEHASEGYHPMGGPQNQQWSLDQYFTSPAYTSTPPNPHYHPQSSSEVGPSSLFSFDPVALHGNSDPTYTALEAYETFEPRQPFHRAPVTNLNSRSSSSQGSQYSEDYQHMSETRSVQTGSQRQYSQHGEQSVTQEQEGTKSTTKSVACVLCHRQHIKCIPNEENPLGPCKKCCSVLAPRTYTLPCLRLKVGNIVFYREGNSPDLAWSQRWNNKSIDSNVTEWDSSEVKLINVSQGYCLDSQGNCLDSMTLEVRKFVPTEKDKLERVWFDGQVRKTKFVEPYAIINMRRAAIEVKRYIFTNVLRHLTEFLDNRDKVIRDTYMLAYKQSAPPRDEVGLLLYNVLCLWFAIRHTTASEYLWGPETLGMIPECDPSYHMPGKIPIAPVLSDQLELILTLVILRPLRRKVLDQLQKMIDANEPKYRFPIYLSSFILLHSCSLATIWQYRYSRRNGVKTRYSMPNYIQELHHGANTLLAQFHYPSKGSYPLSLKHEFPAMAEISREQRQFLTRSVQYFEARKEISRKAKEDGNFHDEMYFVSQLFEDRWQPGPSI